MNRKTTGQTILAIDPGSEKCGLAVLDGDQILLQEIVPRSEIVNRLRNVLPEAGPIVVGDGTGSRAFIKELAESMPEVRHRVVTVDEKL
mgnify:FL=1